MTTPAEELARRRAQYAASPDRDRARTRAWTLAHPEQRRVQREKQAAKSREIRVMLAALKVERGCVDCGYRSAAEALDFDHVRGTKLFIISMRGDRGIATIMCEIAKCEVRCANCHRIKTARR